MIVKVKYGFYPDGSLQYKIWRNEFGQYNREDGPAVEYTNGTKYWYKNGLKHREDGPACIYSDGTCIYYLFNKPFSKKEYCEEIEKIKKRIK